MKLNVSVCRKEGLPKYGSEGASCSIEFEIAAADAASKEVLQAKIASAYALCDDAVTNQLAAAKARAQADSTLEPGEERERDRRDTEYDDRRDDQDRGRYEDAAPARREDRSGGRDRDRGRDDRGGGGRRGGSRGQKNWRDDGGTPTTGAELWGYAKDYDAVKFFTSFGEKNGFPRTFKEWDERDVEDAIRAFRQRRSAATNGHAR
jgi:hypothetical protein